MSSSRIQLQLQRGDFELDVDFALESRGITAVFGPSGCGKTTLLRAIAGLETHARGTVTIQDNPWQSADQFLSTHRRRVGYVFQEASLFPHLTVRNNLNYARKRAKGSPVASFDDLVQLLQLDKLLERSPNKLSGGERQRVAIARALLVNPLLLLLDEPLAALDQSRKQEILQYLDQLNRLVAIPMVFVSHALDEVAQLADELMLMEHGKIIAQGKTHALLSEISSLSYRDDAFCLFEGKVKTILTAHQLLEASIGENIIYVPLPIYAVTLGQPLTLRLHARDISICLERPQLTSILNILPGQILAMEAIPGSAQTLVQLDTSGGILLAKITSFSCQQLGLQIGQSVFAQIKAVALMQ